MLLIFCLLLLSSTPAFLEEVTFKNIKVEGFIATKVFEQTVTTNNLQEIFLPDSYISRLEIVNQKIPIIFEKSMSNIKDVRRVNLTNNGIIEIKPFAFNRSDFYELDLSRNKLEKIATNAFDNMRFLHTLNLSYNKLSSWNSEWFAGSYRLRNIFVEHNLIKTIPKDAFSRIGSGWKAFVNITLSYNEIELIEEGSIDETLYINELWLDHNKIEKFPQGWLKYADVKILNLEDNHIQCLESFEVLKGSYMNFLDNNPLDCDCVDRISKWALNQVPVDMFFVQLSCKLKYLKNI